MPEEHEGYASTLCSLHPRSEPRPTLGLAAQLFSPSPGERLALRRVIESGFATASGLLTLGNPDAPFFERTLRLADGIWTVLADLDGWPAALRRISASPVLAGLDAWLDSDVVGRARLALRAGLGRTVLMTAPTEEIAFGRAIALAASAGVPWVAFALPLGAEGGAGATAADAERLLALHCLARGTLPILKLPPAPEPAVLPALPFWTGPIVVAARPGAVAMRGPRPLLHIEIERLAPAARAQAWAALLPKASALAPLLSSRYLVEPAMAATVADDVNADPDLAGDALVERVAESLRVRTRHGLTSGVRLLRPTVGWDQLVLSPDQKGQLREAMGRLLHQQRVIDEWGFLARRRGARGVRLLFSGPPGTGKTLSAEVLAAELGVDLLVVDISRVVSKWIGETEKNLGEVFSAAERTQSILLFDEADALFGKRTEVTDARDRYANLETSYLLTRLESYEGVAVLATNLRQNIDPAFLRRLDFVIDFNEPTAAQRKAIWLTHLPRAAPLGDDVDLGQIAAHYAVAGGAIRNASVAAAFLAAGERSPITRAHLVRSIRREYDKSGKAFPGPPAGTTSS